MYIDKITNLFFDTLGGLNFLSLSFALLIIITIIMALIKPLDF